MNKSALFQVMLPDDLGLGLHQLKTMLAEISAMLHRDLLTVYFEM